MAKFFTHTPILLKSIQSDDLDSVYQFVTKKAAEWAIAGFIDEANILLEQLWSHHIPHSEDLWLHDGGFQVLWTVADKFPQSPLPFSLQDISGIEKENWARNVSSSWSPSFTSKFTHLPIESLEGTQLLAKAVIAASEGTETIEPTLASLQRFIEIDKPVGHSYAQAATNGALLAAQSGNEEQAKRFIVLWGQGYLQYPYNYSLAYLMRNSATAHYLLSGILAPIFQLTKESCVKESKEIVHALSERIAKGRMLAYGELSWKQLLQQISQLAIEKNTFEFTEEALAQKSLAKKPATSEQIADFENRLGILLPDEYKDFLLTSNGFDSFSFTGVTLASLDKVDFIRNFDSYIIENWIEDGDTVTPSTYKRLFNALIIGGHEEEQQLFLIPTDNNEWECWHFAHWRPGETKYPNFRYYMEREFRTIERRG